MRMKNAGFTLVELVVTLVILAILAAMTAPALLGYFDKIGENRALNDAKKILYAAQTLSDQAYKDLADPAQRVVNDRISELSDVALDAGSKLDFTYGKVPFKPDNPTRKMYEIERMEYETGKLRVVYNRADADWKVSWNG
ncbi:MAG: prepilin-type N-terminal cleavage/methylation domain-containing protein [Lachnospiraceae bacterium]|nr:prepilin-type N-terminal cleavage/methylation domain-containing protein [Lachnospiraceae bacterium]